MKGPERKVHFGGFLVRISFKTRWTTMAASSYPLPMALPSSWTSLSRCLQKNSGKAWTGTWGFTSWTMSPTVWLSLQQAQRKAECMRARRIQMAGGERRLSGVGTTVRLYGSPRSWPVWVVSLLQCIECKEVILSIRDYHEQVCAWSVLSKAYVLAVTLSALSRWLTPPTGAPHVRHVSSCTGRPHWITIIIIIST